MEQTAVSEIKQRKGLTKTSGISERVTALWRFNRHELLAQESHKIVIICGQLKVIPGTKKAIGQRWGEF